MMDLRTHTHGLIRGLLVGAVVLASASACSKSDRTETGSSNTGAMAADSANLEGQANTVTGSAVDTMSPGNRDSTATPAPAATANTAKPRAQTATPRAETGANEDSSAAGYREMESDTSIVEPRDSARVTADSIAAPAEQSSVTPSDSAPMEVATPTATDTSANAAEAPVPSEVAPQPEAAAAPSDSSSDMAATAGSDSVVSDSASGYSEMARDTTVPEQADTAMAAGQVDVAVQADTDSAGTIDTTEAAPAAADTSTGGHIRPTEDSTEVLGQVNTDTTTSVASADTVAESERIRPPEDSTEIPTTVSADQAETSAAQTDAVGAAAMGGNVSGADAVALMTRGGVQCMVVDPEVDQGVAADMSDTPSTVNPCGLGSMVLTRIWTRKE